MPVKWEQQRKFMGAELQRKREGTKTKTDMSEKELEKHASKKKSLKLRRRPSSLPAVAVPSRAISRE